MCITHIIWIQTVPLLQYRTFDGMRLFVSHFCRLIRFVLMFGIFNGPYLIF